MSTPLVSDTWERGSPYEQYIGRWSRCVAPPFLDGLGVAPGSTWLDVGCGTGALAAAILDRCSPAKVTGVEPSAGFLEAARRSLAGRAEFHLGTATEIPLAASSVDAVVSGLVLNFVPDTGAALAEMRRVCRPAGLIGAYVWDYEDQMELIRIFWDAAVSIDEDARDLHEGLRFPICRPAALRSAFEAAGLTGVEVTALDAVAAFDDFEAYWQPFLGGQGPAPAYVMSRSEGQQARLEAAVRSHLPVQPDGSIRLNVRAWGVRATT